MLNSFIENASNNNKYQNFATIISCFLHFITHYINLITLKS